MPDRTTDVLVAGAGLAGLMAARVLAAAGVAVTVVEARGRVGGKTYTVPFGTHPVDLGAHWVGPTQTRLLALARELGIRTAPQFVTGRKVLSLGGVRSTYRRAIPSVSPWVLLDMQRGLFALERLRRRVPLDDPAQTPDAARLDGMTVEDWKRRLLRTRKARAIFDAAIGSIFCAAPRDMSMLYLLAYLQAGGGFRALAETTGAAQQDHFVGGAQQIAKRMAAALGTAVVLDAPVARVARDEHGVVVETRAGTLRGRYLIVAMAPVLAGRLRYDPPLPPARDLLTQRMPMGAAIKCYVRYAEPFWRVHGLSGEAVTDDGVLHTVFDSSPLDCSEGVLIGFMAGDLAHRWGARSVAERRDAVVRTCTRLFGPEGAEPLDYLDFDWNAEEWSRGGPVGMMQPGTVTSVGHTLRAPIGRIHWAGTETAREWTGYMEGAIESGERAAREVLARLRDAGAVP